MKDALATGHRTVKITPHESYFVSNLVLWKPFEGRSYVISVDNIFPQRARELIKNAFAEKGLNGRMVEFGFFEYDRINKILFLEVTSHNITSFVHDGRKWRTP